MAGYLYDLLGRRCMIAISFGFICLALVWIPYTLPSIPLLCTARGLLGIGIQIQLGNPLINDYVVKSTRGKAVVFQQLGFILGETFAMVVLFNFTKNMEPAYSFSIAAASLFVFGIIIVSSVIERHSSKLTKT